MWPSPISHYKAQQEKVCATFCDLRKAFDILWKKIKSVLQTYLQNRLIWLNLYTRMLDEELSSITILALNFLLPVALNKMFWVHSYFNLFIHDLVKELEIPNCEPDVTGHLSINSLLLIIPFCFLILNMNCRKFYLYLVNFAHLGN